VVIREISGGTQNQVFVADEILAFMYDRPTAAVEDT
jgi:hypothetical protein